MATKEASLVDEDEDYIEIIMSPYNNLSHSPIGSPPQQNTEIESEKEKKSTTSPADEGKLLPPRKLPYNTNVPFGFGRSQSSLENSSFPNFTTDLRLHSKHASTPLESRNLYFPLESRRFSSCNANPPEYLYQWSTEIEGFGRDPPKEHWSKAKTFWLGQRLNAYRAYLKYLFTKSACSTKSSAIAANNVAAEVNKLPKLKDAKKKPFEIFQDNNKAKRACSVTKTTNNNVFENGFVNRGRRSFSGVIHRHFVTKASSLSASSFGASSQSSSFSFSSAGPHHDSQLLFKRSSIGLNSEMERSIEGAIAHCKQSLQQRDSSNKAPHDDKTCSNLASKPAVSGN